VGVQAETSETSVGASAGPAEKPVRAALGIVVFVVALVAASTLGFWLGRQRFGGVGADHLGVAGDPATASDLSSLAALRLPTLDGALLGPSDLHARAVVLEFWATWCGPCVVQAEILELLHGEYGERGVAFLAVNYGEDPALVRRHAERSPFPYPQVLDHDLAVSMRAGIAGLPTVVVLGERGEVLLHSVGITGASRLRQTLDAALAG
jgi:thiol-disulfide isomerase/thioredoxin